MVMIGVDFALSPFTEADICEDYIHWLNDPQVNRFLEVRFARQTYETAKEFVSSFYQDEEKYIWGISEAVSRQLIGTATLYLINRHHGSAEIGLMIGDMDFWGSGASEEAMTLIFEFAFSQLGLRRVTGGSYPQNMGMSFTFRRLGFLLEGKMRQAYILDGAIVDGYRWGLLAEDWEAVRGHGS